MLRIWKLMIADIIKLKRKIGIFLVLIPVIGVVMLMNDSMEGEVGASFVVGYCIFCGMVMSALPYHFDHIDERGFLQMLPAKPGEEIWGHFLFSFFAVSIGFLISFLCFAVTALELPDWRISFLLLGIAFVLTGIQNLFLTAFRYKGTQVMNIMRIVPAFLFFGVFTTFVGDDGDKIMRFFKWSLTNSSVLLAGGVFLYLVFAFISAEIEKGRIVQN